jgi:hypothetical protein
MAENEGFEPSVPCGTHTFQACSLDHSDNSPYLMIFKSKLHKILVGFDLSLADNFTVIEFGRRLQDTAFAINLLCIFGFI